MFAYLFPQYDFVGEWLIPKRKTVGALDFGGASTQITFQTKDTVEDQNNAMTLRLYGQNYSLYTQSFLCYGRDQVLRQLLAHLHQVIDFLQMSLMKQYRRWHEWQYRTYFNGFILSLAIILHWRFILISSSLSTSLLDLYSPPFWQAQGSSGAITHPCYPSAYNVSMKLSQIFDSPCTKSKAPLQYNGQDTLEVVGSGHYQHCLQNMSRIFTFEKCSFSKCSFNGVFQPNVTGSFMVRIPFFPNVHSCDSVKKVCNGLRL